MPSILVLLHLDLHPEIVPVATKALRNSDTVLHFQVLQTCNSYRTSSSLTSSFIYTIFHPITPMTNNQVLPEPLGQKGYRSLFFIVYKRVSKMLWV
jgi:hypothetical protein